ncbi:MFS transporter [Actinomadura violacea]|uniref:MHS family MFS transporter n=1 Tax=Actinomadura violacea TaxID=2819934 RepID=A0ABS3RLJ8_9ACTN|nr:MFS transporter [Actinomadura violacea]MBO2457547.1 MHS family MFS transporter [Actinomadura violacea]
MVSQKPPSEAGGPGDGPAGDAPRGAHARQLRKVTLSGLLGTVIEYYDFLIYSSMAALVFGDLFFPSLSPASSTIAAFGTLAAGYVARPLGGLVFGHFGDRLGRKSMLMVTMALMGVASFLIGVLPTYGSIGIAAPLLLVLLRVVQGVAVGGEWGGAALMVVEHAGSRRRGMWAGIMQLGSPLGSLLSTLVFTLVSLLPDDSLHSWGWRLPFLVSALLLMVGLYVRLRVVESPVFEEAIARTSAERRPKAPALQVLRNPRALVPACAAGIGPFALTALISSHVIAYGKSIGYDVSDIARALLLVACVGIVCIPLFSTWSDRIGRRKVSLIGAAGAVVYAVPLYALINTGSVVLMTIGLMFAQVLQNLMYASLAPMLSEMFGTTVRYTGISLGYQLASLIGAGFTPLLASALVAGTGGSSLPLSGIAAVAALITVGAIWRIAETRGRDLTRDPAAVSLAEVSGHGIEVALADRPER